MSGLLHSLAWALVSYLAVGVVGAFLLQGWWSRRCDRAGLPAGHLLRHRAARLFAVMALWLGVNVGFSGFL